MKTLPVIFFHCFVFFLLLLLLFSRNNACKNAGFPGPALAANAPFADYTVWKNKSFVWKGCCQEKNALLLLFFAYVIQCHVIRKMKEKPVNKNRGLKLFFYEVEGHMQKLSPFGQVR